VANAGGKLNWEPYRGKLGKSLIRDAAESNDAVVYNEVREAWRHLWTRAMVDYQSFWGQRLPLPGHYWHVLVAFHSAPGFFTSEMQLRARCCAETVTRVLASEQLERRGVHDAEQSSAGLGFACLAHEIYSTLNGIEMAAKRMAALLAASGAALGDRTPELRQIVTSLESRVPDLVVNARILRGHAGGDKAVSVVFCLEKALVGIRVAKRELLRRPENVAVDMKMPAPKARWMIKANAGALVTVFFNVLLNAVQQIDMFSALRPRGWVRVATQYYEDAQRLPWALVFITDSGPGIHPEDWERVFDAGHTTKEDGTGLGLHICRQLLSRVRDGTRQASIRIARSVLWAGTTVAIRLPLSVAKE
jgi:signal transduction histidine kinase